MWRVRGSFVVGRHQVAAYVAAEIFAVEINGAYPAYSSGENMDGALLALAAIAGLAALCSCFSAPQKHKHARSAKCHTDER